MVVRMVTITKYHSIDSKSQSYPMSGITDIRDMTIGLAGPIETAAFGDLLT